jgi:hypothetical protein
MLQRRRETAVEEEGTVGPPHRAPAARTYDMREGHHPHLRSTHSLDAEEGIMCGVHIGMSSPRGVGGRWKVQISSDDQKQFVPYE